MSKLSVICLSAAALATVAGCGRGSPVTQDPVAATSSINSGAAGASTQADTPPAETSGGTEPPRATREPPPAVEVASLPIGTNRDGNCLSVRLLSGASEVPAGLRLVITAVTFQPGAIELSGSGCSGGQTSCLGLVLTESSDDECSVPIRATGLPSGSDGVEVVVAARVECPAGQGAACNDYKHTLEKDQRSEGSASVDVPQVETDEDGETSSSPSAPDSSTSSSGSSTDASTSPTTSGG